eukprot:c52272_g1_i1.p1 GENE.c52272_g1_i1~~c52272_g1_i1.p1  ORF type:complete len:324 (+),score=68.92 c52272_g1_i1:42-1013(+)
MEGEGGPASSMNIPEADVHVLDSKDTLWHAAESLTSWRVHSAPVFDAESSSFLGTLDATDVLSYALECLEAKKSGNQKQYLNITLQQFNDHGMLSELLCLPHSTTLTEVMRTMVTTRRKHVAIAKPDENTAAVSRDGIQCYLSVHGIITHLHQISFVSPAVSAPLRDITELSRDVVKIDLRAPWLEALHLFVGEGVQGVCVVDGAGRAVDNVSTTDFISIVRSLHDLHGTAQHVHTLHELMAKLGKKQSRIVACSEQDTLQDVIRLLATENIHRIYVVDEDSKPLAVASCIDVIKAVLSFERGATTPRAPKMTKQNSGPLVRK